MVTEFGKELRKIRIDRGEILKDMADKLSMTSSYLSAIECGKRSVPNSMIERIVALYDLNDTEKKCLEEAKNKSLKSIEISFDNVSEEKQDLALKFARSFEEIDKETIKKIKELLIKKE